MNKKISFTLCSIALAASGLIGCAEHLSEAQCQNMNWYQMGNNDGAQGKPQRDLSNAQTDCAEYHIAVGRNQYLKGWKAGVTTYCQPHHGYNLGAQGKNISVICPAPLTRAFTTQYHRGLGHYCTRANGYRLGNRGADYPSVCTPATHHAFQQGYHHGKRRHDYIQNLESQLTDVNNKINHDESQQRSNNQAISEAYDTIAKTRIAVVHAKTQEARAELNANLHNQYDHIAQLSSENQHLSEQARELTPTQQHLRYLLQKAKRQG